MKRQIIIHGGGFSYEPKDEWTDDYIVSQVDVKNPQCLFLAHTTDDAVRYNEKFYRRWAFRNTRNRTLSLFTPETSDIRSLILESNIIYVGDGNTKSMLALWREWGLDQYHAEAYQQGSVLCGVSAGAICWFEEGYSDSIPDRLSVVKGLGLLYGICNPHHSGERAEAFVEHIKDSPVERGIGVPDGTLVHFVDEEIYAAMSVDLDIKPIVYAQGREERLECKAHQPVAAGDTLTRAPELNVVSKRVSWKIPTDALGHRSGADKSRFSGTRRRVADVCCAACKPLS